MLKFVYDNQNNKTTNIFETTTGVINTAHPKISGNYKIFVSSRKHGYRLYLNDYTDRYASLDITKKFLPQVCNFLQTSVSVSDESAYRYGGFQRNDVKTWHIPLYLGYKSKLPKYFVITKTENRNVSQNVQDYLYSGKIIDVIDLSKIYLTNIFKECVEDDYFNFPVIMDFDSKRIDLYGYNTYSMSGSVKSFFIEDETINYPEFEKINQTIENKFKENNMFFGRFINLEFEFDYDTKDDESHFSNFYGFLSYGDEFDNVTDLTNYLNSIDQNQNIGNNIVLFSREINNDAKTYFRRLTNISQTRENYNFDNGGFYVRDINEQDYLYRVNAISYILGDCFKFYNSNNELVYEYKVKESDIKNTKHETFVKIADSISQNTLNVIQCKCSYIDNNDILSFVSDEEYRIDIVGSSGKHLLKTRYKTIDRQENSDNFDKFMNLTFNDLLIVGNSDYIDTNRFKYIRINDITYNIVCSFMYDGKFYIRLDDVCNITSQTVAVLIEERLENILLLRPIDFMKYESNLNSKIFSSTEDIHGENGNIVNCYIKGEYQYVDDEIQNHREYVDEHENVLMFSMNGCTSFITPYVLNTWKTFYQTSGSLNYGIFNNQLDLYRFNWFLIKGPDQYSNEPKNDVRHLRYFSQKPLLSSRLSKISSSKCETTFLGVKYQLPIDFKDWQFSVYANIEYTENGYLGNNINKNYKVIANSDEQTIHLVINKYLKYNDFFGLGERNLDIGFLLNVRNSMNDSEPHPQSNEQIGFYIGGNLYDTSYRYDGLNDWIHFKDISIQNDKDKIYIKKCNQSQNWNEYFVNGQNIKFSYPIRLKTGESEYTDAILFDVEIKNIENLTNNDFWCDDIVIKLYPNHLYKTNDDGYYEIYKDESQYSDFADQSQRDLVKRFFQIITDINPNNKQIFYGFDDTNQGTYEISFKKNYFRMIYKPDGSTECKYFDDFYAFNIVDQMTESQKIQWFETNTFVGDGGLQSYNGITHDHNIIYDVFDTNIVMSAIKLMCSELYCVSQNITEVRRDIEEYSFDSFLQYSLVNNIDLIYIDNDNNIVNSGSIKITPIYPIENSVVWSDNSNIYQYMIKRFNGQYNVYLNGIKNDIEKEFQTKRFKCNNTLFSMFDNNYGKLIDENLSNVTATGIWEEVEGNILSTLFTKNEDIIINDVCLSNEISCKENIKKYVRQIQNICYIINDDNENYLSTLTINIREYIYERYSLYLLNNHYYLQNVIDTTNNERIYFEYINDYTGIRIDDKYIGKTLKFIYKRK